MLTMKNIKTLHKNINIAPDTSRNEGCLFSTIFIQASFLCSIHSIFSLFFIEHSPLTCNPRFGCHKWMILSVQSQWKFSSKHIFLELEWLKHLKFLPSFDEVSWNQIEAMSYDFLFSLQMLQQLHMHISTVSISSSRIS